MNCILCRAWQSSPYPKRHTTPVAVDQVEGVLILGYFLGSVEPRDAKGRPQPVLCERHFGILNTLYTNPPNFPDLPKIEAKADATSPAPMVQVVSRPVPPPQAPKPLTIIQAPTPPTQNPSSVAPSPSAVKPPPAPEPTPEVFPCPACGGAVKNGEVHTCSV